VSRLASIRRKTIKRPAQPGPDRRVFHLIYEVVDTHAYHVKLVHAYDRDLPLTVLIVESIMYSIGGGFSRLECCAAAYIVVLHSGGRISDGKILILSIGLEIALVQTFQ
jgi:hypothetical protein